MKVSHCMGYILYTGTKSALTIITDMLLNCAIGHAVKHRSCVDIVPVELHPDS